MDREELVEQLREDGVPDALYVIPGVQEAGARADAHFVLEPGPDGGWTVCLRERTGDTDVRHFRTEDEACRDLRSRLTAMPPPPRGGT